AFFLAGGFSVLIAWLSYTILPAAEFQAHTAIARQGQALLLAKLRSSGKLTIPPYTVYVKKVQGTELIEPVVKRFKESKDINSEKPDTRLAAHGSENLPCDLVMNARSGELSVEGERVLLKMWCVAVFDSKDDSKVTFGYRVFDAGLPWQLLRYSPH